MAAPRLAVRGREAPGGSQQTAAIEQAACSEFCLLSRYSSNKERTDMNDISTDKLVTDLKAVARDTEELLKASAGEVTDKAREARARLSATLERARDACARLEEKAVAGARATDKIIRDHPYQSIGIAFGVGVLLGVLVSRR
jgi:ElaB/YqjD/DUF883 family membrane-anchored ribosome-binding protein